MKNFLSKILLNKNLALTLCCKSKQRTMKYNELHKLLSRMGCRDTGRQRGGHPLWFSPITGNYFKTSNHGSEEVKPGTLKSILRDAGIK